MILLDDQGMVLVRQLFEAHDDLCASIIECPEWRSFAMSIPERKVAIYRNDLIPRLHAAVDCCTAFIAHYVLLFRNRDVPSVRDLSYHILIDRYAHLFIGHSRSKFARWNLVSEEVAITSDLVIVLRKCDCIPNTIAVLK